MEKETKKAGLLGKLFGTAKADKKSPCCGFQIEEIKEEDVKGKNPGNSSEKKGGCCCG